MNNKQSNNNYNKVTIGKGEKKRKVPKTYIPESLSESDKKKQAKSILQEKKRPKLESFESKPSPFIKKFIKKYDKKITDKKWIHENLLSYKGQREVLDKAKGAYFSSGSRPNQTAHSWGRARLASSITSGKAAAVDYKLLEQGCKKNSKALKLAKKSLKKYKMGKRKAPKRINALVNMCKG